MKLLTLSEDRTKIYFIEQGMRSVIETNLKTMKKRAIRAHHITNLHDRIHSIFSYKSELYGITQQGFGFIINTVQNKVLFRRKLEGTSNHQTISLICRCNDTIAITDNRGFNLERLRENNFRLTLYDKHFKLLASKDFVVMCSEKQVRNAENPSSNFITGLQLIPTHSGRPLVGMTIDGTAKPFILFSFKNDSEIQEIASLNATILPEIITSFRYLNGYLFFTSRDKTLKRFELTLP